MKALYPLALAIVAAVAGAAPVSAEEAAIPGATAAARPHHVYLVGSLRISQPWIDVAATAAGVTAAYVVVENRGTVADRLVAVSVPRAKSVTLMSGEDGGLAVPPHGKLTLQPGGTTRIAVQDLQDATPNGSPVAGTLTFKRAGTVHVAFSTDQADALQDDQSDPSDDKPVDLSQ